MCTAEAVDPTDKIPLCDEHLAAATGEDQSSGEQSERYTETASKFVGPIADADFQNPENGVYYTTTYNETMDGRTG
ncbi:hypothetical protein C477_02860 [Haloterrigena salina JCM 13891]|uniref:Uncharacterized protein n=1 Tax=Haloterrigena salina JCM 13891 TaxID=1227488 RepID=M0CMD9_9EURY|nr:hypothetical protein [Haloterrigena salina]ELZ23019.1 hypothetical protein C477_02860 [Haloterrigena salina JCM 13891]